MLLICRLSSVELLLDGNPATIYRSKDKTVIRLKDPSHILLMNNESTVFTQKDCIHIIFSSPQSAYSVKVLQDCMKHFLTEFGVNTLVIQPEHSDCDLSHIMIGEFLLWSMEAGYLVKTVGNTLKFTRWVTQCKLRTRGKFKLQDWRLLFTKIGTEWVLAKI